MLCSPPILFHWTDWKHDWKYVVCDMRGIRVLTFAIRVKQFSTDLHRHLVATQVGPRLILWDACFLGYQHRRQKVSPTHFAFPLQISCTISGFEGNELCQVALLTILIAASELKAGSNSSYKVV
jgi:hypothetical protein